MTHDSSVPMCCVEKMWDCQKQSWRKMGPYPNSWGRSSRNGVNLVSMMTTLSVLGSQVGLTQGNTQISESLEIINCQENQILVSSICPTNSYHLSFDQNFKWCQKKKRSRKDLVGVSLFLSQSLKVILNCSTKSKEVVIHINYIYIPNVTSRELIVGLLT